jgi:hypothetical protein
MAILVTHFGKASVFWEAQRVPFAAWSSDNSVDENLASGGYVGVAPGFA